MSLLGAKTGGCPPGSTRVAQTARRYPTTSCHRRRMLVALPAPGIETDCWTTSWVSFAPGGCDHRHRSRSKSRRGKLELACCRRHLDAAPSRVWQSARRLRFRVPKAGQVVRAGWAATPRDAAADSDGRCNPPPRSPDRAHETRCASGSRRRRRRPCSVRRARPLEADRVPRVLVRC